MHAKSNSRTIESYQESIALYKSLLEYSKNIRDDYLKNVETFSNQLLFKDVSEQCYIEMYSKIQPTDKIPSTTNFLEKIDG